MTNRKAKNRRSSTSGKTGRRRPIEEKIFRRFDRYRRDKVIDLTAVKQGKKIAAELMETIASDQALAELHPSHALYVLAQNHLSILAEQLTALEETDKLTRVLARMEEIHTPSGPPMSPLSRSFFTCWSLFDLSAGLARETYATLSIAIGQRYGMSDGMLELMSTLQASRMGIYRHEGFDQDSIVLRELITDTVHYCLCPSGYKGQTGELWYVRLLPPPAEGFSQSITFTTPYVLTRPGEGEWLAYFDRALPECTTAEQRINAFEHHMKYGPSQDFWLEFVFEAYVNYRPDVVFLRGLPDIEESRPCSRVNMNQRQGEVFEQLVSQIKNIKND